MEWEVIHVNYSYLLEQMAPDEVLPQLAAQRLLTPERVREVWENTNQNQKIITILETLHGQKAVGRLSTFCAVLASTAGQEHVAEKLMHGGCIIFFPMFSMNYTYSFIPMHILESTMVVMYLEVQW